MQVFRFLSVKSFQNFKFQLVLIYCTGNKPHACHICPKRFALACNLRAHLKTHQDDEGIGSLEHLENMDNTSSPGMEESEMMLNEDLDQTELTEEEEGEHDEGLRMDA